MTTLAQTVTQWSRKAREATQKRNDAIRAMRADGASLRAVAQAAEMNHNAIAMIVKEVSDG